MLEITWNVNRRFIQRFRFSKLPNKGGDKTPIELDGGKDPKKRTKLGKGRGWENKPKKISDTVKKINLETF